ncbi:hypothetical protein H9P43_006793 [Blastocladiella emersonii ATCC 22665]|nr:hypothetical protein H9P43_006793 [Blastocladiella emersonii ATCC 22665]
MGYNAQKAAANKKRARRRPAVRSQVSTSAPEVRKALATMDAASDEFEHNFDRIRSLVMQSVLGGPQADPFQVITHVEAMLTNIQRVRHEMYTIRPQRATAAEVAQFNASLADLIEQEALMRANLEMMYRVFGRGAGSAAAAGAGSTGGGGSIEECGDDEQ